MNHFAAEQFDPLTARRFLARFQQYFDNGYRDPELLYLGARYALILGRHHDAAIFLTPLDEALIVNEEPLPAYAPVALLWLHHLQAAKTFAASPNGRSEELHTDDGKLARVNGHLNLLAERNGALEKVLTSVRTIPRVAKPQADEIEADPRVTSLAARARTAYEENKLSQARSALEELLIIDSEQLAVLRNLVTVASEQEDIAGYERYWRRFVKLCLWRMVRGGARGDEAWTHLMRFYVRAADMMEQPLSRTQDEIKRVLRQPGFLPRWIETITALIWLESAGKSHRLWQTNLPSEQTEQGAAGNLGLMRYWFKLFYPEFEPLLDIGESKRITLPLPSSEAKLALYFDPTERLVSHYLKWHTQLFFALTMDKVTPPDGGEPQQAPKYDEHADNIMALAACVACIPLHYHTLQLNEVLADEKIQNLKDQSLQSRIREAINLPLQMFVFSKFSTGDGFDFQKIAAFFDAMEAPRTLSPSCRMIYAFALCSIERVSDGLSVACDACVDATVEDFAPESQNRNLWQQIIVANINHTTSVTALSGDSCDAEIEKRLSDIKDTISHALPDKEPGATLKREGLAEVGKILEMRRLQDRVDAAIKKVQQLVQNGNFAQAKRTIRALPDSPDEIKTLKQQILSQIDQAEVGKQLQNRVDSAIKTVQGQVENGNFVQAKRTIHQLPDAPEDVKKLKQQLLAQIDEAEKGKQLQERVDAAIKTVQDQVASGNFTQARRTIRQLPDKPDDVKKLKQQLLTQIDDAEKNKQLQGRVDAAIKTVQGQVANGNFTQARRTIRQLPDTPSDVKKLKQQLLSQIDDAEKQFTTMKQEISKLETKLQGRGISTWQINELAKANNISIDNPGAYFSLLQAIDQQFS